MEEVERPGSSTFEAIRSTTGELHRAQATQAKSVQKLTDLAGELQSIGDQDERLRAASWLYWMVPELHAKEIAAGALGASGTVPALLKAIADTYFPVGCDGCAAQLRFPNRTAATKARTSATRLCGQDAILCQVCLGKVRSALFDQYHAARDQVWEERARQAEERLDVLRRRGARSFLDSDGWYYTRRDFLADRHVSYPNAPPEESGYICDSDGCPERVSEEDVYYASFEQWWMRRPEDLTALCSSCHMRAVEGGVLPGPPVQAPGSDFG